MLPTPSIRGVHALRVFACLIAIQSGHAFAQYRLNDSSFGSLANAPKAGEGKWEGSIGAGMTATRGNSESTQFSLSGDAARAGTRTRTSLHALLIRSTSNGARTADNQLLQARHERNITRTWFGFGDMNFERAPLQNLTLRQIYSAGAGYRLFSTDAFKLNVYAGAGYTIENNRYKDDASGVETLFGNDLSYKLSENASILQRFVLFPTTVGTGGKRAVFQLDLNTRISGRLGLQVSFLNKYREHVDPGQKHSDSTLFTGITAKF